ncbi:hypothetical protein [Phreatobacter oligotrophus]|jgi:hypothetical protein|uniref:Uncharacterized protein n=1 Tax=Phreatobacter oligotrophus TaxID=1122261 RepID=A0A2T4ZIF6_9HYPH|nr:hypothetical protein [Phreatobacter oligotrophus]PTM61772.1 hypothetical protein C8P69_101443 [Phreatobacter oligotrophus]
MTAETRRIAIDLSTLLGLRKAEGGTGRDGLTPRRGTMVGQKPVSPAMVGQKPASPVMVGQKPGAPFTKA